ncbi:hypothetical protein E2C01_075577 [Portunus trituberculatus]|uniref:MD-2-related lipid-recognition domain-containing protein n=1 Tax=Portunus trituberculatus TaxID=210409 RepID=A0A5B7IHE7_PORTR|nr:hypothetical protein [Portunus trituberculatus]
MNCSSLLTDTCYLKKGHTYLLQAEFVPQSPSEDVESSVAWRSWVEMPLPGQDSEACDGRLPCPLTAGTPVNFTYPLHIEDFWMRVSGGGGRGGGSSSRRRRNKSCGSSTNC